MPSDDEIQHTITREEDWLIHIERKYRDSTRSVEMLIHDGTLLLRGEMDGRPVDKLPGTYFNRECAKAMRSFLDDYLEGRIA